MGHAEQSYEAGNEIGNEQPKIARIDIFHVQLITAIGTRDQSGQPRTEQRRLLSALSDAVPEGLGGLCQQLKRCPAVTEHQSGFD